MSNSKPDDEAGPPPGSIDFEITDFGAARAALDEPPPGVKALKQLDPSHWIKQRRTHQAFDARLSDAAMAWLEQLPPQARPLDLQRSYPRIVNQLAEVWNHTEACLAMFDDLVVDQRGGRRGFPSRVALEIVALRDLRAAMARRG